MSNSAFVRLRRRSFTLAVGALAAVIGAGLPALSLAETPDTAQWVIDADDARTLLSAGAVLQDTRREDLKKDIPVEGAVPVVWQDFTKTDLTEKGQLLDDDAVLTEKLRALGTSSTLPVIAIADSAICWGEDGRIVWTLRTLGHETPFSWTAALTRFWRLVI